jgi:hypothetical protein
MNARASQASPSTSPAVLRTGMPPDETPWLPIPGTTSSLLMATQDAHPSLLLTPPKSGLHGTLSQYKSATVSRPTLSASRHSLRISLQTQPKTTCSPCRASARLSMAFEGARKRDLEDWLDAKGLDLIVFPANRDVGRANSDVNDASSRHAWTNGVKQSMVIAQSVTWASRL